MGVTRIETQEPFEAKWCCNSLFKSDRIDRLLKWIMSGVEKWVTFGNNVGQISAQFQPILPTVDEIQQANRREASRIDQ